jgi:hypothetical protein
LYIGVFIGDTLTPEPTFRTVVSMKRFPV